MTDHHPDELVAGILPSLPDSDSERADRQSPAATKYEISTPSSTLSEKTEQNLCVAMVGRTTQGSDVQLEPLILVPRDVTVTDRGEQQNVTCQEDYSQPIFSFPTARLSLRNESLDK